MRKFAATLRKGPVQLGVTDAAGLAAMQSREDAEQAIASADREALVEMAQERGIAFHPAASPDRIRARLLKDL